MADRPNIVLIMTDEMRGDCMGFAGHPDVKTPYLDTLASQGVYFPHAYSSCPTCVPARAILHTGLSQRHTGKVGYQDGVDWNYGCTMAGELAKAGYYTQCVGKMHVHPLRNYLGFHNVELHDGYLHEYRFAGVDHYGNQTYADDYFYWLKEQLGASADVTDSGMDCNGWTARPWPYEEKYHPTNWVASRSIDFLRRRDPRQPFFLMASFVRPHAPYDAPQWYFDLYKDKDLRPPFRGDWDDQEFLRQKGRTFNNCTGPLDPELIRQQQIGYYACITHVDHQIGRLLMALTEHRLMDNTVILFTSDHGEMLSDHGWDRKSLPYEGSARIPMLIWGPEKYVGPGGRVDESLVELRDVMPTCLDLAGAPIPAHLDGQSMLHGVDRQWLHGEHTFWVNNASSQFIVTTRDKFIWFSQRNEEQYFDLEKDPHETHNAIHDPEYQDRIAELRHLLAQALKDSEEGYSDGEHLIPGHTPVDCLSNVRDRNCPENF